MCTVQISGAIDRREPDPSGPSDNTRAWIGMLEATWTGEDGPVTQKAAILKVTTGRGCGDPQWGTSILVLRWIGDPPPPQIAQSVYDVVENGGPDRRPFRRTVVSQPRTESQPSYRAVPMARAS